MAQIAASAFGCAPHPGDPHYVPLGFALGSQTEMVLTCDKIWKLDGGDFRRTLAVHEQRVSGYASPRRTDLGLMVVDVET